MVSIKKLVELTGHRGPVYSLIGFHQGILSAGSDRMIVHWKDVSRDEGQLIAQAFGPVFAMKWLERDNRLLVANDTGGIHVIDLSGGSEIRLLQYHTASVFALLSLADYRLIVAASADGTVTLFTDTDYQLIKRVKLSDLKVRCLFFLEDKKLLAAGTGDGLVLILTLPEMQLMARCQAHQPGYGVNTINLTPDKKFLITGSRDAHISFLNIAEDFKKGGSIPAHNYSVYAIVFSPDGRFMATASRDKTIKIWDSHHFTVLKRISLPLFPAHTHSVNQLLWNHSGLFSAGDDRRIMLWQILPEELLSA
jgi:WD40 repeat protein